MKDQVLISILTALFLYSCKGKINPTSSLIEFVDTASQFRKEIPTYSDGGVSLFYSLTKTKQKQLELESIENGFDNLQIRIWYDFSLVRERKLVIISNTGSDWSAVVYNLQVDWDGQSETILSKKLQQVRPKSGWESFLKILLGLKILTLPHQNDIPKYGGGNDGNTYNVEVATKRQYRFYGYWGPQMYQDKHWQAKNMAAILKLLDRELGVCPEAKNFGGCK